jgi:hypothetical protein
MHIQTSEYRFQPVQRQMISELPGDDMGGQSRSRQALFNRLGRLRRNFDLRLAVTLLAPEPTGLAGIFAADVLQDFETGGDVF